MSQSLVRLPSATARVVRRAKSRAPLADPHAPWVLASRVAFPEHRYPQHRLTELLEHRWRELPQALSLLRRLHPSVGVATRHTALALEDYASLSDFGAANNAFLRVGTELAAEAIRSTTRAAGLATSELDAIFFTTVTGIGAPSIDARLVGPLGLKRDIRRTPMFGLGCLGGAAGLARASDYLRAYPTHAAVLLAVELCSLTIQDDVSAANVIASGLFGDAAAAVVLVGSEHAARQAGATDGLPGRRRLAPRIIASRSVFFPDTEHVMGWDVGGTGFKVILSAEVPTIAKEQLPAEVDRFLADHGLGRRDVARWVCHPGGPKVISALEEAFGLGPEALSITRESLASVGNLSSVSVLHVLEGTEAKACPGDIGLLLAMGPGFCAELVLLEWP